MCRFGVETPGCTRDPAGRGEGGCGARFFGYFFGMAAAGVVVLGGAFAVFGGECAPAASIGGADAAGEA